MDLRFLLVACASCWAFLVRAQNAMVPLGGEATGSGGSVSYTLGQVADEVQSGVGGLVQEGVQQPYVDASTITATQEDFGEVSVYPTVTADHVMILLSKVPSQRSSVTLFDAQGRPVLQHAIVGVRTELSLALFANGVYQLILYDEAAVPRAFTLIKVDHP